VHVACIGESRGVFRVLVGSPEGKSHLQDPDMDGRIILRRIVKKWDVRAWTGSMCLRIGTGGRHV